MRHRLWVSTRRLRILWNVRVSIVIGLMVRRTWIMMVAVLGHIACVAMLACPTRLTVASFMPSTITSSASSIISATTSTSLTAVPSVSFLRTDVSRIFIESHGVLAAVLLVILLGLPADGVTYLCSSAHLGFFLLVIIMKKCAC